ncbi:MAG: tRNA (adenine-N(6)-)-methyltransferase [Erysipelotrichia bacterium]|nr:tRNA (adenine-N(6)-)-methyltransferase [Erysipelotrichia bacterium]
MKIWLPFDEEWSAFNQVLKENGYETICTHINNGKDFFKYEPKEWDMIVSNPPYSMKDEVIKRVYELGKPFCLLMPLTTLQGKERFKYFKQGIQLLSFNVRIGFHNESSMKEVVKNTPFSSAYFIGGGLLKHDSILEELKVYEKQLIE